MLLFFFIGMYKLNQFRILHLIEQVTIKNTSFDFLFIWNTWSFSIFNKISLYISYLNIKQEHNCRSICIIINIRRHTACVFPCFHFYMHQNYVNTLRFLYFDNSENSFSVSPVLQSQFPRVKFLRKHRLHFQLLPVICYIFLPRLTNRCRSQLLTAPPVPVLAVSLQQ